MGLRRVLINCHQWHNNALCRAFFSDFPCVASRSLLGKITENALVVYLLLLSALLAGCKVTLYSDLTESEANQMLALLMMNRISAAKQQNKAGALTLQVEKTQFIQAVE